MKQTLRNRQKYKQLQADSPYNKTKGSNRAKMKKVIWGLIPGY